MTFVQKLCNFLQPCTIDNCCRVLLILKEMLIVSDRDCKKLIGSFAINYCFKLSNFNWGVSQSIIAINFVQYEGKSKSFRKIVIILIRSRYFIIILTHPNINLGCSEQFWQVSLLYLFLSVKPCYITFQWFFSLQNSTILQSNTNSVLYSI